MKKILPILSTSFVVYFYCAAYTVMGYMVNDFPGQDSVLLIATLPALVLMFAGWIAGWLMQIWDKRNIVLLGLIINMVAGLAIRFVGANSLILCLICASITGLGAGLILPTNYPVLVEVAPEALKDKVCGWSDALATGGMAVTALVSGFLAGDGDWANAYNLYWIVVPVLIIAVLFYPHSYPSKAAAIESAKAEAEGKSGVKEVVPKAIIAMLVIRFISAFFYQASDYWASDFAINEAGLGSSVLVGVSGTVANVCGMLSAGLVFLILRKLKGFSTTVLMFVLACSNLLVALFPSQVTYLVAKMIFSTCIMAYFGCLSTVSSLGTKGDAVGKATSWLVVATFAGEFICTYSVPFVSKLIFGNSLSSSNLISSAIFLIVISIINIPVFKKAYACAFSNKEAEAAEA